MKPLLFFSLLKIAWAMANSRQRIFRLAPIVATALCAQMLSVSLPVLAGNGPEGNEPAKAINNQSATLTWNTGLSGRANTAKDEKYLSVEEREVLWLLNSARTEPLMFIEKVLKPYYPDTGSFHAATLLRDLRNLKPVNVLYPDFQLSRSAKAHAADMGRNGMEGTYSSEGQPFYDRIHMFVPGGGAYGEAYWAGGSHPVEVALNLLLDAEDSLHRQRRTLLSPKMEFAGVSIKPHLNKCSNAVVDLVARPHRNTPMNLWEEVPQKPNNPANVRASRGMQIDCPPGSKVVVPKKRGKKRFLFF